MRADNLSTSDSQRFFSFLQTSLFTKIYKDLYSEINIFKVGMDMCSIEIEHDIGNSVTVSETLVSIRT